MAAPKTAPQTKALAPVDLTPDDYNALLVAAGFANEAPTSSVNRIKMDGPTFYIADEPFISNLKTGKPAFIAQVVGRPREYQSLWIDDTLAANMNRPEAAGGFCKSHFDVPTENRKFAEDGTPCGTCPAGPWIKQDLLPLDGKGQRARCKWKADIELRVLDAEGQIADETVYTLTLPTTAIMEWGGTAKERVKGSVSELNFIQKLVRLGAASDPEDPKRGVARALIMLDRGGVIVEVRALPAKSDDGARSWSVISFTPIAIHDVDEAPAITAGGSEDAADDAYPF